MLDNIKVSIITVSYNAEKTIEQTINSVLNQTYPNIEYIIIDGNSQDGTLGIINKYKHRISQIVNEPDNGIYDAMNKGLKLVTGDIVGIINSDDWYELNAIEIIINVIYNTGADIVYGKLNVIENEKVVRQTNEIPLENMWHTMSVPHPATFVKRSVYDRVGLFDVSYNIAADYDFLLKAYSEGIIFKYINSVIANFRSNGVSSTKLVECAEETKRVTLKYMDKCPNREFVILKNEERINTAKYRELCNCNPFLLKHILSHIFQQEIQSVSIIGTGVWGVEFSKVVLKSGIEIEAYYDNMSSKWGKTFNGINIQSLDSLQAQKANIIIAIKNESVDVEKQLAGYHNPDIHWVTLCDIVKKYADYYNDVRKTEQIRLIKECRKSGLSDY